MENQFQEYIFTFFNWHVSNIYLDGMNETLAKDETDDFDRGMTGNLKAFNKKFRLEEEWERWETNFFC